MIELSFIYFSSRHSKIYFLYKEQVYYVSATWDNILKHASRIKVKRVDKSFRATSHPIAHNVYRLQEATQPNLLVVGDYIMTFFHTKKVSEELTESYKELTHAT